MGTHYNGGTWGSFPAGKEYSRDSGHPWTAWVRSGVPSVPDAASACYVRASAPTDDCPRRGGLLWTYVLDGLHSLQLPLHRVLSSRQKSHNYYRRSVRY